MLEKVQADRQAKLEKIRELGIDPYGGRYDTAEPVASVLGRYQDGVAGQSADVAGRLVLIRDMGKMIFAHVRDQSGQMQVAFRKNALDETAWALAKLLDMGDVIAAAGPLERTKTGEITIWADRLTLLTKSLNPMPEKYHGLQDVEIRYRQRYLDLMTNPESLQVFQRRIAILDTFRDVLRHRGFVEVETPVLQPLYGGAAARPFTTHHNALDCNLFLRISPELYLKRLLVGGMERVYEFSRNFRNEGIDTRHNPEFTLMELYQAYADYGVMMEITEELVSTAARTIAADLPAAEASLRKQASDLREAAVRIRQRAEQANGEDPALAGSDKLAERRELAAGELDRDADLVAEALRRNATGRLCLPYGGRLIDYAAPWPRKTYDELLREHAGVSMFDGDGARAKARTLRIDPTAKADAVIVNEVFEAAVEPALAAQEHPTFVVDYPAEICPLTRRHPDDDRVALRFELFIAGMEIANAYTELNDPAVQEANFRAQLAGEAKDETMRVMDEDFVTALRHGMPPAGGLGVGIDRVIMLLTNRQSIRDVILFPLLRPE